MKKGIVFNAILFVVIVLSAFAQNIPSPQGHVNDFAGIISQDSKERLESTLRAYEKATSIEIAIVTVPSLQDYQIEEFTIKLANQWGVGKKINNGLVILLAPNERKWRIEVGTGLEPYVTDAAAKMIGEKNLKGTSKTGKYGEALEKVIAAIQERLGSSAWEIREENRRAEQKKQEEDAAEAGRIFLNVVLVIAALVVFGLFVGFLIRSYRRRQELMRRAKQTVVDVRAEYNETVKRVKKLDADGFKDTEWVLREIADIESAKIIKFEKMAAVSKKYSAIIATGAEISAKLKEMTKELFENDDKRDFVAKTIKSVVHEEETVRKLLPDGLDALHALKKEAPKKVWSHFDGLKENVETVFTRTAQYVREAKELSDMKEQKFRGAAVKIEAALKLLEEMNGLIQDTLDKLREWEKAKEKAEKHLSKKSKDEADKILHKGSDDGMVNWILIAALIASQSDSHNESSYHPSDDRSPSNNDTDGGFSGGSFSGGGASGDL